MVMYPACVYPQLNGDVVIELPDFSFSVKGDNMLSAMSNAVDTLTSVYSYRLEKGREIHEPSELSEVRLVRKLKHGFKAMVYVDPEVGS